MDEIKEFTDAEKKAYDKGIYSDRLLSFTTRCPEDGASMKATGNMYLHRKSSHWMVEYLCPKCKEFFNIWTPEVDAITKRIAKDVLGKKDG